MNLLPIRIKKSGRNVPNGSRWAIGFSVSLPWRRGVGSPSLSAAKAWANSCTVMATSRLRIKTVVGFNSKSSIIVL
jgi:hypothetical protein